MVTRAEIEKLVRAAVEKTLTQTPATHPTTQPASYAAPWTGVAYEAHPSQQQLNIGEAAELQSQLLELNETQLCLLEKNRLCDHCGVCRSLGF
jgi:hypothetical protein